MARARLIIVLCLAFLSILVVSNIGYVEASETSATAWAHDYGMHGTDCIMSCVIQTVDGGFIIGGNTGGLGGWLVKTDTMGNNQWNKTYPAFSVASIVQSTDQDYALHNGNFMLTKIDQNGNIQWSRTNTVYGEIGSSNCLIETSDGGYVMAGGGSFVKTDSDGNMQWKKSYNGGILSVAQTNDGGYALAGQSENETWHWAIFWLAKTDSSGELQWNKTYGRASTAYSVIQTADGGYALTGTNFLMVKTDPEGNMQWTNTYGKIGITNYAYSIIQTDDLGYALGGYTGDGGWAFRLLKIDALGNEQWNGIYGIPRIPNANVMYARAVQTSDGGFAIAGTEVRDRLYGEFLLIKTDENGVVPEFPALLVLPICIIATILVVYITKKYLPKNCEH